MEQVVNKYEDNKKYKKILKLLPYIEIPLKKSMRKIYDEKQIQLMLIYTREEFRKILNSMPIFESGYNRNAIATAYSIAFLKISKKYRCSQDIVWDVLLNAVDSGVGMIPLVIIRRYLDEREINLLKNIKNQGIRSSLKNLKSNPLEIKVKIKKEIINTLMIKENAKEFHMYLELFAFV